MARQSLHKDRKGITNVIGAILFVLAIVALTSIIAIVAAEYSSYVRSADYLSNLERERSSESLYFTYAAGNPLRLNITNTCSSSIKITQIVVHNKTSNSLVINPIASIPIVLNPGMTEYNYSITGIDTARSNATIMIITSRDNAFVIVVEGGNVIFRN
ncbi:MAG: hypothetical protein Metus_0380 [Candidatus Methanosuratincola subterraneus]|uniref:Archaeal Type IV pilin N-terminal domain-containing protein n=1 Tax=Methanosuratincola subterraneus TaxID=2593994 RepID=A0A444L7M7_METS7|nr:MAG: hypothetical protein Metus_0380 [Candidatus Methanosuratincola subterraneus]